MVADHEGKELDALYSRVQKITKSGIWSKGVAWARSGSVTLLTKNDAEFLFSVKPPEATLAVKVQVWPEEDDFYSDCEEPEPCAHTVAALVAFQNRECKSAAEKLNHSLCYVLEFIADDHLSKQGRLVLQRYYGEPRRLFRGSLVSHIGGQKTGRVTEPWLIATRTDLQIDEILQEYRGRLLDRAFWYRITPLLSEQGSLVLRLAEGELPVKLNQQILSPRVSLKRQGRQYQLKLWRHESVEQTIGGVFAKTNDSLQFIHQPQLQEQERSYLSEQGALFSKPSEIEFLFGQLLPRLREEKFQIEFNPEDVPNFVNVKPQLKLVVESLSGLHLGVVARLEYPEETGGKETIFFKRDLVAENSLKQMAFSKLGLRTNEYYKFQNAEAAEFLGKIKSTQDDTQDLSIAVANLRSASVLDLVSKILDANAEKLTLGDRTKIIPVEQLAFRKLRSIFPEALDRAMPRPLGFRGELRNYQTQGVAWILEAFSAGLGIILADDMGLGKTIQALAALRGPALIVCPTSLIWTWESQILKFREDLQPRIFHGAMRSIVFKNELSENEVVITSYGLLRQDVLALSSPLWRTVVFDESQFLRNRETKVFQAALTLSAQNRIGLTGTPIENKVDDLRAQLEVLNPDLPQVFTHAKQLLLRRNRNDVLKELPPLTENRVLVELSDGERELYDALLLSVKKEVLDELGEVDASAIDSKKLSLFTILEHFLRLRQAACHPGLLPPSLAKLWQAPKADENEEELETSSVGTSSKVKALMELLNESQNPPENRKKVILFSQWTSFLDLLEKEIGLKYSTQQILRLDGSTRDRNFIVKEFQENPERTILLMSLKAGGVGLNLTAAEHVFLMDPWWNPAVEDQAIARAHRMGQTKPVFVHRLITRGTVEERVGQIQSEKRDRLAEIFASTDAGGESPGATPSRAVLSEILRDLLMSKS